MNASLKSMISLDESAKFKCGERSAAAFKGEYENLLRQFLFLNELVSLLFSSTSVEEVLRKIVSAMHRMLNIDRVGIISLNSEEKILECTFAAGLEEELQESLKIHVDECKDIIVNAAISKGPFLSHSEAESVRALIYEKMSEQPSDSLIFPLFSYRGAGCMQNRSKSIFADSGYRSAPKMHTLSGKDFIVGEECVDCRYFPLFGFIWMDNKSSGRKFSQELVTLYTLVLNMNVAVEHKLLIEQLTDISIKDTLTGAFNRNYLFSALEKELERALREQTSLSVAMIDLDNFKQVNDIHGHQYGDKFLQAFSQYILQRIRKMDYFCRYGGDEFVIILPGARAEQALQVINRLTERIKTKNTELKEIQISAGIASYPECSLTSASAQELLEHADRALYSAKRKGKGTIEIFPSPR